MDRVVVQNVVSFLLNSHLFDLTKDGCMILRVDLVAGTALKSRLGGGSHAGEVRQAMTAGAQHGDKLTTATI